MKYFKTSIRCWENKLRQKLMLFCCFTDLPHGYKKNFLLNSAEKEIFPAHKCLKCQQLQHSCESRSTKAYLSLKNFELLDSFIVLNYL